MNLNLSETPKTGFVDEAHLCLDISDSSEDQDGDEEEEEIYDDLFCVACNRAFKSEKA